MTHEDKESLLFEIGFVWGVCWAMCADKPEVFDSLDTVKDIVGRIDVIDIKGGNEYEV